LSKGLSSKPGQWDLNHQSTTLFYTVSKKRHWRCIL